MISNLFDEIRKIRRRNPTQCLFSPACTGKTIKAHSVPKSILQLIQQNNHVIQPETRFITTEDNLTNVAPQFLKEGINEASTGSFTCSKHDQRFRQIDNPDMDMQDYKILDLLMYRAAMKELWTLLKTNEAENKFAAAIPRPLGHQPDMRLMAMNQLISYLTRKITERTKHPAIKHITRRIKTTRPTIAASCAGASSNLVVDRAEKTILPMNKLNSPGGIEPNSSWTINIIPREDEHIVIASYIGGGSGEKFFNHLRDLNGKSLAEAVSAELILFCENWFINPQVWESFSDQKKGAITETYNNLDDMIMAKFNYEDRPRKEKWYEFLDLTNRHQINLFA